MMFGFVSATVLDASSQVESLNLYDEAAIVGVAFETTEILSKDYLVKQRGP
jgi:hypothetical protein